LTLFDVLDPSSIDPDGYFVLAFAGDRAGMATNAASVINDETKIWHNTILSAWKKEC